MSIVVLPALHASLAEQMSAFALRLLKQQHWGFARASAVSQMSLKLRTHKRRLSQKHAS
jgi:hypothetical protein